MVECRTLYDGSSHSSTCVCEVSSFLSSRRKISHTTSSSSPSHRYGFLPSVRVVVFAVLFALVLFACDAVLGVDAKPGGKPGKGGSRGKRKGSHLGAADKDYHLMRDTCAEAIKTDPECVGNDDVVRENCVLRCVSPECYDKLYGHDPLEEGELDTTRGRLFRNCVRSEMKEKKKKEAADSMTKDEI